MGWRIGLQALEEIQRGDDQPSHRVDSPRQLQLQHFKVCVRGYYRFIALRKSEDDSLSLIVKQTTFFETGYRCGSVNPGGEQSRHRQLLNARNKPIQRTLETKLHLAFKLCGWQINRNSHVSGLF